MSISLVRSWILLDSHGTLLGATEKFTSLVNFLTVCTFFCFLLVRSMDNCCEQERLLWSNLVLEPAMQYILNEQLNCTLVQEKLGCTTSSVQAIRVSANAVFSCFLVCLLFERAGDQWRAKFRSWPLLSLIMMPRCRDKMLRGKPPF